MRTLISFYLLLFIIIVYLLNSFALNALAFLTFGINRDVLDGVLQFSPAINMENNRPEDLEPPVKRQALENLEDLSDSETDVEEATDSEVDIEEDDRIVSAEQENSIIDASTPYTCWAYKMLDEWGWDRSPLIIEEQWCPDERVNSKLSIFILLNGLNKILKKGF